jgi:hypothetical protein
LAEDCGAHRGSVYTDLVGAPRLAASALAALALGGVTTLGCAKGVESGGGDGGASFGSGMTTAPTGASGGTDIGDTSAGSLSGTGDSNSAGSSADSAPDPDCEDEDGDGYGETCNGIDDNCDEMIDNGCECPDDGVSGNCNMPTDIGMLVAGDNKLGVVGNLPTDNAFDWYVVRYPTMARPGEGTPTIQFAINEGDAFVFDVVTGQCDAAGATCTSGGNAGAALGLTSWSFVDDDPGCCTPPMDSLVAWPNELFLRVYRTNGGSSCAAYQLQFSR